MKKITALVISLTIWNLGVAQNLVINNARIIDGNGRTFEQGSLVIRDGRIVSISESAVFGEGVRIDADGMTVMPGLIDTHRHLFAGVVERPLFYGDRLQTAMIPVLEGLLEKGLTTVLSPTDPLPAIFALRQRIADGELKGPRLLTVGPAFTAPDDWPVQICRDDVQCRSLMMVEVNDPSQAQARVAEIAALGVDAIKVVYDSNIVPSVRLDDQVFEAIAEEARRQNLDTIVHVGTVEEMLTVVRLGADRLVHVPAFGRIAETDGAVKLREAGVPVTTTVSWYSPAIEEARGVERSPEQVTMLADALANIRHIWDEGVIVAFGTDNPPPLGPTEFIVEVQELSAVLSPEEIIMSITRNAAMYLNLGDELGTLESGKIADIVIIDGDPLADIMTLANVKVVIQSGRVAVDNR